MKNRTKQFESFHNNEMKINEDAEFTTIGQNEYKLKYKDYKFLLKVKSAGVYGMGQTANLYQLDGLDKKFIKSIGWISKDGGYGSYQKSNTYLPGIVTIEDCKQAAIKYVDELLD